MKIKHKFSLLVAACTLLLLGINYGISVYSANNAFLEFYQRSAIILSSSSAPPSDIDNFLKTLSSNEIDVVINALFEEYADQIFIVLSDRKIHADSLDNIEENKRSRINLNTLTDGYQFEIKHPDKDTLIVQISSPQVTLTLQDIEYQVFYFPKSTLTRQIQQETLRRNLNNRFLISLSVLSVIAIMLSWLGASYFLRPLTAMKASFLEIKIGEWGTRVPVNTNDEVGELIDEFNQLVAWLQGLHQQYAQMNSDLSHELRTPLNAVQSRIEAMEDGVIEMDKSQLGQLREELSVLARIVDDLSLLSITESQTLQLRIENHDISELTRCLVERYRPRAQELGLKFASNIQSGVYWKVDKDRLRQVLVNLIDNAFKYGFHGGEISLILVQDNHFTRISVVDKGRGLTEEQCAAVFERFFRVQASRSSTNSLGLGLPICRHLVGLMSGNITVESTPGEGSEFIVTFLHATS